MTPPSVPSDTKQGGGADEYRMRLVAKPWVWTDCMVTAPTRGVKGGRWYIAGPTPSLRSVGCSAWWQPMPPPVTPLGGKTTDRRAGCGRTARPVRRGRDPGNRVLLPLSGQEQTEHSPTASRRLQLVEDGTAVGHGVLPHQCRNKR